MELETLAVVWAISHFVPYLYGYEVTVLTDHTAVKAILQTPNPSGKHARWWTKVYASGVKNVKIQYLPGRLNSSADTLSHCQQSSPVVDSANPTVAAVMTTTLENTLDITVVLSADPAKCQRTLQTNSARIVTCLKFSILFRRKSFHLKGSSQWSLFTVEDDLLCYMKPKQKHQKRVTVPRHLQEQILKESRAGGMGGPFSGRTYAALVHRWWCDGMHADTLRFVRNCPACSIASGIGKVPTPYSNPMPLTNHWSRHNGSTYTKNDWWKFPCSSLPRLSHQMASCIPGPRPEVCHLGATVIPFFARCNSILWCSGSTALGPWY